LKQPITGKKGGEGKGPSPVAREKAKRRKEGSWRAIFSTPSVGKQAGLSKKKRGRKIDRYENASRKVPKGKERKKARGVKRHARSHRVRREVGGGGKYRATAREGKP